MVSGVTTNNVLRNPGWDTQLLRNNLEPTNCDEQNLSEESFGWNINCLSWNPPLVTRIDNPHPASLKIHFINLWQTALCSLFLSDFPN